MSMHLAHPAFSTTGKRKGKVKFRNAEAAKKARELEASWEDLKKKYASKVNLSSTYGKLPEQKPYRRETPHIPSLNSKDVCGVAVRAPDKVYTGTMVKGIGTMHKSNAVPIFNDTDAIEISRMRR